MRNIHTYIHTYIHKPYFYTIIHPYNNPSLKPLELTVVYEDIFEIRR
jgi:hypothetical protein